MSEGEDKDIADGLKYRGGTTKEATDKNDPHSLGFGDLVKDEEEKASRFEQLKSSFQTGIARTNKSRAFVRKQYRRAKFYLEKSHLKMKKLYRKLDLKAKWQAVRSYDYKSVSVKDRSKNLFRKLGPGEIIITLILLLVIVPMLRTVSTNQSTDSTGTTAVSGVQDSTAPAVQEVVPIPNEIIEADEPLNYERNDELGYVRYQDDNLLGLFTITQQALPPQLDSSDAIFDWLQNADGKVSIDRIPTDKGLVFVLEKNDNTRHAWFNYNDALVIISTRDRMSVDDWKNYINTLN
ncbi:MAG: hypothetical protein R3313_00940 [Candidatus Saccharimonadales bacterium]|nr:hypothetical protein [Candidatus Saccharimonadales bacterium]